MRILLAVLAIISVIPVAAATPNVVSTYGTTNLYSTDWSAIDKCNNPASLAACNRDKVSGESDGAETAGAGEAGEGEGGDTGGKY